MWLNPNSRGSRLRIWQPWGCKSRVADRRVVHREKQTGSTQDRTALGVQVSPRRPIGMSTGQARRTCLLNSGLRESGVWCESTAFRHVSRQKEECRMQKPDQSHRRFLRQWLRCRLSPGRGIDFELRNSRNAVSIPEFLSSKFKLIHQRFCLQHSAF